MLEETKSWPQREEIIRSELEGKALLGQVNITEQDLEHLARDLRLELQRRSEGDAKRFLKANAPLSTAVFLVWCGIKYYRAGNFWDGALRLMGLEGAAPAETNKARRVLGEVFRHAVSESRLESFPRLAEHGHRYVTPILAHGGIPDYCLDDFFEHLIIPAAQGRYGGDFEDLDEIISEFFSRSRAASTDKPVRNFLRYGGIISRDLVRRCIKMASRYIEGGEELKADRLHLPPAVTRAFYEHVKGREFKRRERRRGPLVRPGICLLPYEECIVLTIPEAEIPLPGAAQESGGKLFYSIRCGADEFHLSRARIGRYLKNGVLLEGLTVVIPKPYRSLTVTLFNPADQSKIFERRLDFLAFCGDEELEESLEGCSWASTTFAQDQMNERDQGQPSVNQTVPYLVFGEEDEEGCCRFTGDTVKALRCWLVKRRSARIPDVVRELEEINIQGTGWSDFHAVHVHVPAKDLLTILDEASGAEVSIPVRLDLREQVKVRGSGLLPDVTWSGKPVYEHPPILEFPPLQEPDRLSLELEDAEGGFLGEFVLGEVVERREDGLLLKLGDLEPLRKKAGGLFRCSITGKLGERMELDFACLPGLRVEFGEEARHPDLNGRSHSMEARIGCDSAREIKVEDSLASRCEKEEDGRLRLQLPPHLTSFSLSLLVDETEINLRVRVPRFAFRFEKMERDLRKTGMPPSEPSWQGRREKTGREIDDPIGGVDHTSLVEARLKDLFPYSLLEIALPRPCESAKLYLEGLDTSSVFPRRTRNLRFKLGEFLSAMESHSSCSFRFRLRVVEENGTTVDFPFLTVRKGWVPLQLTRETRGGQLRLQWLGDEDRTLPGEVLLKNLYRPWEEPVVVRVEAGESSCTIPIPWSTGGRGMFLICFRLLDEWGWPSPSLPFQLPTDAYRELFYIEGKSFASWASVSTQHKLESELEKATETLLRELSEAPERRRSLIFDGIRDDSREEDIRAVLLTLLFWSVELGGHYREVEERLCEAVRGWASAGDRWGLVTKMLDEMEDEGGKPVAAAVESLRLRLSPEEIEPPFDLEEKIVHRPTGRVFIYLGVETVREMGKTYRRMKMVAVEGGARKKRGGRTSHKSCSECRHYFPIDKCVEFAPVADDDV